MAENLSKSIDRSNRPLLDRICGLLDAQREELLDIKLYAEGHRLPTLGKSRDD